MNYIMKKISVIIACLTCITGISLEAMESNRLGTLQELTRIGAGFAGRLATAAVKNAGEISGQNAGAMALGLGAVGLGALLVRYALQPNQPLASPASPTREGKGQSTKDEPFPITNLGNMCYANAPVQALCAIPVLRDAIVDGQGESKEFESLQNLVLGMFPGNNYASELRAFVDQAKKLMDGAGQKDSGELLDKLLERAPLSVKKVYAIELLDQHGGPRTNSILELCNLDGQQKTLTQLLLEVVAQYNMTINKLAPVFIVRLNDDAKTLTTIPLQFNTKEFDPSGMLGNKIYALRAAICHRGTNGFGHYTAYVQRSGDWYLANDARISEAGSDILPKIQGDATVLFYEQENSNSLSDECPQLL